MTRAARWVGWAAGLLAVVGCGGDGGGGTGPGTNGGASVRVAAGPPEADTVLAAPLQALVVEVRNSDGELARGAVVRFQVVPTTDTLRPYETGMFVCALQSPACAAGSGWDPYNSSTTFTADTTDAAGRAKAALRFGTVAGAAKIVLTVPEFGLLDTLAYTVRPGAVAGIVFTVPDTTVAVGARYRLGGAPADRFGNARTDAIAFSAGAHASVTTGGEVTTVSAGRGRVLATSQGFTDTAYVSVVPVGTLVAYRAWPQDATGLVTVSLDGTGLRMLHRTDGANGAVPSWMPGGTEVLYQESGPHLTVVNQGGDTRRLLAASPHVLSSQQGRLSKDGAWVYFHGYGTEERAGVWRAAADGSGATQLAGASGPYASQPSPSPDGTRVAFNVDGQLKVLTLETGVVTPLGVEGSTPRWSPDGALIAYVGYDGVNVVRPDGTGRRRLSDEYGWFELFLDWSPDSQWLVARRHDGLVLLRASNGETLPLRMPGELYQPSWKP